MNLGILGGSFNPVHNAHLVVATRVAEALDLDRVLFIPTAISPLKPPRDLAPAPHRWAMLRLALRGNPRFRACDLEMRRGGVSYTVDTLREIRRRTEARLHLIVGADALNLLPQWKESREVRALATLVVVARPGHRTRLRMPKNHIVDVPLLDISGTEIRDRVCKGLSVRYLVPEAVERYIRKKGLYR
jgi:nicotinate-nucleotide adenylyltransferase